MRNSLDAVSSVWTHGPLYAFDVINVRMAVLIYCIDILADARFYIRSEQAPLCCNLFSCNSVGVISYFSANRNYGGIPNR